MKSKGEGMKKHHATVLIVAGIIAVILATTITLDTNVDSDNLGYVVDDKPSIEAVACCTIGEKTCYALDGSCAACDVLCG